MRTIHKLLAALVLLAALCMNLSAASAELISSSGDQWHVGFGMRTILPDERSTQPSTSPATTAASRSQACSITVRRAPCGWIRARRACC